MDRHDGKGIGRYKIDDSTEMEGIVIGHMVAGSCYTIASMVYDRMQRQSNV